ncbi:unnamed protein product [Rangifer tarandus platyrhynchus]|uniref:Uncharacterized protein n=1 Tax=Rangifer tarandus platyrhynchus TaxID=3082113 RepID=A0AC59Z132_RANTA
MGTCAGRAHPHLTHVASSLESQKPAGEEEDGIHILRVSSKGPKDAAGSPAVQPRQKLPTPQGQLWGTPQSSASQGSRAGGCAQGTKPRPRSTHHAATPLLGATPHAGKLRRWARDSGQGEMTRELRPGRWKTQP